MASVARPLSHDEPASTGSVTPLIAPGHTYRSITEKISGVILSGDIPTGWFVGIAFALVLLGSLGISAITLLLIGTGIWGINIPDRLGIRHHQLCLVDRNWSRWNADFRRSCIC